MSFRLHGNYCGPGWSDGKWQSSVAEGKTKPIDEFDKTCQKHDSAYAKGKTNADLDRADQTFYTDNFGKGLFRSASAIGVKYGNQMTRNLSFLEQLKILLGGKVPEGRGSRRKKNFREVLGNPVDDSEMINQKVMVALDKAIEEEKLADRKNKIPLSRAGKTRRRKYGNVKIHVDNLPIRKTVRTKEEPVPALIDTLTINHGKMSNKSRRRRDTRAPAATSRKTVSTTARTTPIKDGIRVQHRELFTTFNGSALFSSKKYELNPGLPCTFPWLARLARNFERYSLKHLRFEYISNQPTSAAGRVTLAFDPDANNSAPRSKQELCQMRFESDNVWKSFDFDIKDTTKIHYIRGSGVPNTDIKTYDIGFLVSGVDGMSGSGNIGELYVSYDIELYKPHYNAYFGAKVIQGGSGKTPALPLGVGYSVTGYPPFMIHDGVLIFCENYRGLLAIHTTGTGITDIALTPGSATSVINNHYISFNGTAEAVGVWSIDVANGDTLDLDNTGNQTTVVEYEIDLGEYNGYATGELS